MQIALIFLVTAIIPHEHVLDSLSLSLHPDLKVGGMGDQLWNGDTCIWKRGITFGDYPLVLVRIGELKVFGEIISDVMDERASPLDILSYLLTLVITGLFLLD